MGSDRVHVAFAQKREDKRTVLKTKDRVHLAHAGVCLLQKHRLGLGGALDGDDFVLEVGQRADVALGRDGHRLVAGGVGPHPGVEVFSPRHRETAGRDVDLARLEQGVFVLPHDVGEVGVVAYARAGLAHDVDVDARGVAVLVEVVVGWVVVRAHGKGRARADVHAFVGFGATGHGGGTKCHRPS